MKSNNTPILTLYAYKHSVYSWIARIALAVSKQPFRYVEVDPFEDEVSDEFRKLTPWKRVPVLCHGDLTLYETSAITSYLNETFCECRLTPSGAVQRASVRQLIAIIDRYGYWPMVRQVFANGYYCSLVGQVADPEDLEKGLQASAHVLDAIEPLIDSLGPVAERPLNLGDIHLAPMMDYFLRPALDSGDQLAGYPALGRWWDAISDHSAVVSTRPVFD